MNKLLTKIVGVALGATMAVGVGLAAAKGVEGNIQPAYAGTTDTTYTFTNKSWDDSSSAWTSDKDGNQLTSGRGVQITTGVSGAGATSKASFTNISKITFTYSTNDTKGAGSISVKVGTGTAKTFSVTKTGGTSDRTTYQSYSPNETGAVNFTVSCTTNSIYIKSITITTYSGDPTPEPALVQGTLAQFFADSSGNKKQRYQVSGYVSNWKSGETDGTEYGNFYVTQEAGTGTEYYIYGVTATASALAWNSDSGVYDFTNPKDFLTDPLTSTIDIGSLVTMILTRCDYNTTLEGTGIVTNVEQPAVVTLESITGIDGELEVREGATAWDLTQLTPKGTLSDSASVVDISSYVTLTTSDVPGSAGDTTVDVTVTPNDSSLAALTTVIQVDATVTEVQDIVVGDSLLIEPSYLQLAATYSSATTLTATDGGEYKTAPGGANSVKNTALQNGCVNAFDSTKEAVLMGKNGAYFYNDMPYSKAISKLELYSPKGASTSVKVTVEFAARASGPIEDDISSSTNVKTLSTADSVYDYSVSGMLASDYRYFRIQVTSAHNAQFQLRLTFADDEIPLNSITLSHPDLVSNELSIGVGASKTLSVTFDPTDATDQTLVWTSSNDSVATVANGVISVPKTATVGSSATITATPNDTHASAKSITVNVVDAVVKSVDMRYGLNNTQENRVEFTEGASLSWPSGAIQVTLTDDSVFYDTDSDFDSSKLVWYYNNSDSGSSGDVLIDDLASFTFQTSMKRMRLSYDGVLATSRAYITVNPAPVSDFIISGTVSGNNDFYVEDMGTLVIKAPAGYTVCAGASDEDEYFAAESFVYDEDTQTFSADFAVYADEAQTDVVVTFYLYSSDYSQYLGHKETIQIINPTGLSYARTFATWINQVCAEPTQSNWENLSSKWDQRSAETKAFLTNAHYTLDGDDVIKGDDTHYEIAEAISRYDYMVKTYHFDNFMGRTVESNRINPINTVNSTVAIIVVATISVISVSALGAYFLLRKKKEER